jgi:hypothetical protein
MDSTAVVGSEYSVALEAVDPDDDDLSFSFIESAEGMELSDNLITWTPAEEDIGDHLISVEISDGNKGLDTLEWTIVVADSNHPPEFTATDMDSTAVVGNEYSVALEAVDPDDDDLTFSFVDSVEGMELTDSIISWTPALEDTGNHQISVEVSDGNGGFDTMDFTLIVLSDTSLQFIEALVEDTVFLGTSYSYTAEVADAAQGDITYAKQDGPQDLSIDDSTGVISWDPVLDDTGKVSVFIPAGHQYGGSDTLEIVLTVLPDTSLHVTPLPEDTLEIYAGRTFSETIVAGDAVSGTITYTLVSGPQDLSIDDSIGIIFWFPVLDDTGTVSTLIAAGNEYGGSDTVEIVILVMPDMSLRFTSLLEDTLEVYVDIGDAYIDTLEAADSVADTIIYVLVSGPEGLSVEDSTGIVSWDPALPADTSSATVSGPLKATAESYNELKGKFSEFDTVIIAAGNRYGGSDTLQFFLHVADTDFVAQIYDTLGNQTYMEFPVANLNLVEDGGNPGDSLIMVIDRIGDTLKVYIVLSKQEDITLACIKGDTIAVVGPFIQEWQPQPFIPGPESLNDLLNSLSGLTDFKAEVIDTSGTTYMNFPVSALKEMQVEPGTVLIGVHNTDLGLAYFTIAHPEDPGRPYLKGDTLVMFGPFPFGPGIQLLNATTEAYNALLDSLSGSADFVAESYGEGGAKTYLTLPVGKLVLLPFPEAELDSCIMLADTVGDTVIGYFILAHPDDSTRAWVRGDTVAVAGWVMEGDGPPPPFLGVAAGLRDTLEAYDMIGSLDYVTDDSVGISYVLAADVQGGGDPVFYPDSIAFSDLFDAGSGGEEIHVNITVSDTPTEFTLLYCDMNLCQVGEGAPFMMNGALVFLESSVFAGGGI